LPARLAAVCVDRKPPAIDGSRTVCQPHPLDVGHVNLRPSICWPGSLSSRLSDFDDQSEAQLVAQLKLQAAEASHADDLATVFGVSTQCNCVTRNRGDVGFDVFGRRRFPWWVASFSCCSPMARED